MSTQDNDLVITSIFFFKLYLSFLFDLVCDDDDDDACKVISYQYKIIILIDTNKIILVFIRKFSGNGFVITKSRYNFIYFNFHIANSFFISHILKMF